MLKDEASLIDIERAAKKYYVILLTQVDYNWKAMMRNYQQFSIKLRL
jgi:hypothetical protein